MARPDPPPLYPATYIRLATSRINWESGQRAGVFSAAYDVLDEGNLAPEVHRELRRALRWFEMFLHSPRLGKRKAVFWFRSDAGRFVNRLWRVIEILRTQGVIARMMLTSDPGSIVYKDRHQVAATPRGSVHDAAAAIDVP